MCSVCVCVRACIVCVCCVCAVCVCVCVVCVSACGWVRGEDKGDGMGEMLFKSPTFASPAVCYQGQLKLNQ